MTIDYKKLEENLPKLTGNDFIECENAVSNGGVLLVDARYNSAFQARLAATALEVPYPEIAALPVKEFKKVTAAVFAFLFATESETPTPSEV